MRALTLDHAPHPEREAADTVRGLAAIFGATLGMATGFGSLVLGAVFMDPLQADLGWTRTDVSLGYAAATVGMALGGLLWGRLSDRLELRALLAVGGFFMATPLVAMAFATAVWQFHVAHFLLGFMGFGCLYPCLIGAAGVWFGKRRGLVMGVVTAGGAVGQGLMPWTAEALIGEVGWRQTYLVLALFLAAVQIGLLLCVRRPRVRGAQPPAGAGAGFRFLAAPRVVVLSAAAFFCCACMGMPLIHLAGHVSAICGSTSTGATSLLYAMSAGTVGRVLFGMAADRIGPLPAYLAASVIQSVCLVIFPVLQGEASLLLLSVVFGFGFAGNMTCLIICVRSEVPAHHFGSAIGLVMFLAWAGMGVGGLAGGALTDITGTYSAGFLLSAGFGAANILLLLSLMRAPWRSKRA
jgi:MFS family permease